MFFTTARRLVPQHLHQEHLASCWVFSADHMPSHGGGRPSPPQNSVSANLDWMPPGWVPRACTSKKPAMAVTDQAEQVLVGSDSWVRASVIYPDAIGWTFSTIW